MNLILWVEYKNDPCIRETQENSIENSVQDSLPYMYELFLAYAKPPCVLYIV